MAHICSTSTWETKSKVWGQPGMHSEFQAIQGYIARRENLCPYHDHPQSH